MKKLIGLIPLYDDELDSYWMLPGYMQAIEECGGVPVMLPLTTEPEELRALFDACGGLLLTGGQDVNPALYGEAADARCGAPCRERDEMEKQLFDMAMASDKPVLGICRGIQLMNALLGGDLWQDLPTQHPSETSHRQQPPYDQPCHKVEVLPDTMLASVIGAGELAVNSHHHQAVRKLAPGAIAQAISEDGLVEAIAVPGKRFVLAVQWHPEFCFRTDEKSRKIVQAFVEAVNA